MPKELHGCTGIQNDYWWKPLYEIISNVLTDESLILILVAAKHFSSCFTFSRENEEKRRQQAFFDKLTPVSSIGTEG